MPPTNEELFEMLLDLQPDFSALSQMMFEADPLLAEEHRKRSDENRRNFRLERKERLES